MQIRSNAYKSFENYLQIERIRKSDLMKMNEIMRNMMNPETTERLKKLVSDIRTGLISPLCFLLTTLSRKVISRLVYFNWFENSLENQTSQYVCMKTSEREFFCEFIDLARTQVFDVQPKECAQKSPQKFSRFLSSEAKA